MGRPKGSKNKNTDPASSLEKKINPETVDAMRGMTPEELNERIVQLAKNEDEVESARDQNEKIAEARSVLQELEGPYKDSLKEIKATRKFAVKLLEEKGKA
jgi:hypothetical protein